MIDVTFKANNVKLVGEELENAVKRALMECGATAENYAKRDAPVDTGRLRNSMAHKMVSDNTVAIGSDVEYAKYQELGTLGARRGIKPKYFLTNAVRDHIGEYESIIRRNLK